MDETTLRAAVERRLRRPVRERTWEYARHRRWLNDVLIDGAPVDSLVENIDLIEDFDTFDRAKDHRPPEAAPAVFPGVGSKKLLGERQHALAYLIAVEASGDVEVERFRNRVLDGRLLAWAEVESWIKQLGENDGPLHMWITAPAPADFRLSDLDHRRPGSAVQVSTDGPISFKNETLDYAVPDDRWVRRVVVAVAGVLDWLRRLSEQLARRYRWRPAAATVFILTDLVPDLPAIEASADSPFYEPAALRRIVLTIDPTTRPDEVAALYRRFRQRVLGRRYRSLSERHIRLAVFAADRPSGQPLATQMEAWNAENPKWAYSDVRNFSRDANSAQRHLLGIGRNGRSARIAGTENPSDNAGSDSPPHDGTSVASGTRVTTRGPTQRRNSTDT